MNRIPESLPDSIFHVGDTNNKVESVASVLFEERTLIVVMNVFVDADQYVVLATHFDDVVNEVLSAAFCV